MLVLATGGHWFFLQSIAWVQMTVNFARQDTLTVALQKTFDGQNPCDLCKMVKRGKAAEEKREKQMPQLKFDFQLVTGSCELISPRPIRPCTPFFARAPQRGDAPAIPPPRAA